MLMYMLVVHDVEVKRGSRCKLSSCLLLNLFAEGRGQKNLTENAALAAHSVYP